MVVREPGTTSEQRALAARIDAAGWGIFFLWVGIASLAKLGWAVGLVGVGVVVLGAQAWRSLAGVKVERFSLAIGVVFAVAGLWSLLGLRVEVLPLLFIAAGIAILASTWRSRHRHGGDAGLQPPQPRAP